MYFLSLGFAGVNFAAMATPGSALTTTVEGVLGGVLGDVAGNLLTNLFQVLDRRVADHFLEGRLGIDENQHIERALRLAQIKGLRVVLERFNRARAGDPQIARQQEAERFSALLKRFLDREAKATQTPDFAQGSEVTANEQAIRRKVLDALPEAFDQSLATRRAAGDTSALLASWTQLRAAVEAAVWEEIRSQTLAQGEAFPPMFEAAFAGTGFPEGWFDLFVLDAASKLKEDTDFRRIWQAEQLALVNAIKQAHTDVLDRIEQHVERTDTRTERMEQRLTDIISNLQTRQTLSFFFGFADLIDKVSRGFTGRRWLFNQIDEFRRRNYNTGGYIHIKGLPGSGKTAIAAQLARHPQSLLHFFTRNSAHADLSSFLTHIYDQAAGRFGVHEVVPKTSDRLEDLFWQISNRMERDTDCLVIADALDETDPQNLKCNKNPLGLPRKLCRGVFIIVTSRDRQDCQLCELDPATTPLLEINLHQQEANRHDAVEFIQYSFSDPKISNYLGRNNISREEFEKTLVTKSEGNFMYLRHVLPEVANGILTGTRLEHLPKGLQDFYAVHWQAMRNDAEGTDLGFKMSVLSILARLEEPYSARMLLKIVKGIPKVLERINAEVSIQQKLLSSNLQDLQSLLVEWQEFLLNEKSHPKEGPNPEILSRIYHLEFRDFLRREPLHQSIDSRQPIDLNRIAAEAFYDYVGSQDPVPPS
jgi:hypothetical protein